MLFSFCFPTCVPLFPAPAPASIREERMASIIFLIVKKLKLISTRVMRKRKVGRLMTHNENKNRSLSPCDPPR